jgi:high-affinity nickel-transport protein
MLRENTTAPDAALSAPGEPVRQRSLLSAGLFGPLGGFNLAAWAWAFSAFHSHPAQLGAALLAWVFGLRHAMDADHIAAIDNVVRKLVHQGRRAETVGLWFSLGHSTVVVLVSLAVAVSAVGLEGRLGVARQFGGVVGTLVSAGFLSGMAMANLFVLRGVWRSFCRVKQSGRLEDGALDTASVGGGVLARVLSPVLRTISQGWQMYPLGVLFGLGFDTATEIAVIGLAAAQASGGVSTWQVMVFPTLFAAGMALVDTLDSALMAHAYGWAFINPLRKLRYNLTMTAVSVMVAFMIAMVEVLGLIARRLPSGDPFGTWLGGLDNRLGDLGFAIVALFGLCWFGALTVHRVRAVTGPE